MSIFATLGKKGRVGRKTSISNQGLTTGLKDQSENSNGFFKSTPNLHNVDGCSSTAGAGANATPQFESPSSVVYYDYEKNPRTPFRIFTSEERDRGGGGKSLENDIPRRSSNSSLSSMSQSIGSADARHEITTPNAKTPFSAFRGFVTMVSAASGVKKTKSIRRKAFASATHLRNTDHSHRETEGVIHEDIAALNSGYSSATTPRRSFSMHRSVSIKSSQSVPNMEDGSHGHRLRYASNDDVVGIGRRFNGEPGVESSSTSLSSACTNPSISENDSFVSSRSRCPSISTRSDNFDPELQQNDPEIQRKKLMLQGAKKFNMDPKKGIDFMVLNGLVERTPGSVAQFLKLGELLSKSAIGNYLGEHHEFNLEVLHSFVELHDFTNVLLVEALRQFLWSFRLPGEAQKIDRMMECFAKRYTSLNPTLFANSDTCYLLSFAIIMLNTSLHNPNVKEKPSLEQFIQMNRDIDDGQPLDRKFITSLYNSILTEPFQIPPEDGNDLMLTFFDPAHEGWLWKQGERYKGWKRRWFILSNNCLYYFLFTTDKDPRGIIPLENIKVKKAPELGKEFCFTLYKESSDPKVTDYIKSCKASDGKLTAGKHLRYHLATKTKEDRDRWIAAIAQNSSYHNFYTIVAQKKNRLEAQGRTGTLKRNRGLQTPKAGTSVIGQSPGAMRKSQIGLPLTRLDLAKSFNHIPSSDLLSPDHSLGRNPHEYFTSTTASTSDLAYDGSGEYFGQSDSESSLRVSDIEHKQRTLEGVKQVHSAYSTQSLPRTKSKKKQSHRHIHMPPLRKFSLPPDALASRLLSRVEYLTSPGIRISVEDTSNQLQNKDEKEVIISLDTQTATYFNNVSAEPVPEISPVSDAMRDSQFRVSTPPLSPVTSETPATTSKRCPSSLILALRDLASVMESLNVDDTETVNESEWADLDANPSIEELNYSGLTKQCLRSSFKSKRSRYRNKHRKFPSEANRKATVIPSGNTDELNELPDDILLREAQYPPFEISVIEDEQGIKSKPEDRCDDTEFHSEV